MPVIPIAALAISVGATVASSGMAKKASDAAANTATQTAAYNAKVDAAQSDQIDKDTIVNIQNMRKDAATYVSRQAAAYAGAGIVANKGSALAVQAATIGKTEMRAQNMWAESQAKEENLASAAAAGVAEGAAQADQYHMEGIADVLNGASKVATEVGGAYNQGLFKGGGGGAPAPAGGGYDPANTDLSAPTGN
jgi:hypothetical protein